MSTTSTIGSAGGRNYTDPQSWWNAFAVGGWIGEMYNDSLFAPANTYDFNGKSTSSTDFARLTAATGQSFVDNGANPLQFDQSKGVAIDQQNLYRNTLSVQNDWVSVSRLQLKNSGNGLVYSNNGNTGSNSGRNTSQMIFDNAAGSLVTLLFRQGVHTNFLLVERRTGGVAVSFDYVVAGTTVANATIVRPSNLSAAATAITNDNGSSSWPRVINTSVFNFSTLASQNNSSHSSGSNNATDLASIGWGSGNQTSLTYTAQFNDTTVSGGMDFKVKAGSALIANGNTDTTDIPGSIDIFNNARGVSWTIGCYQYPAAGGSAGTMVGAAVVAGVGKAFRATSGTMAGVAVVAAVGHGTASVAGTCAGAAVVAGAAFTLRRTAGACTGAAVVAGFGIAQRRSAGTCAGAAVVSGVTNNMQATAGTCAGAAVVAGVGKTIIRSSATCLGAAVVSGGARAMARMAGTCTGNSSCNGITSGSVGAAAGTCAGAAVVAAFGARRVAVAGTCVGAAVVAGVGKIIKPSAGTCAGAAVVVGGGRVRVPTAGTCAGAAVVSGATAKRIGGAGTCAGAAVVLGVSGNGGLTPAKGVIIAGATVQGYGGAVPMANYLNILEGEREYG